MYTINFNKIKDRDSVYHDDFKGVWFNYVSSDSEDYQRFCNYSKTKKIVGYPPILGIDESIPEHFTQILFILKESYTDIKTGFKGWLPFTEKYLTNICEKDYWIYKSEWGQDGIHFVKMFPEKIKEFLNRYCDTNQ